jgi:protein-L-isoaspartate O-methyltransferase
MHDKRFPASQAERLDNPERLVWLPPAEVIGALAVRVGDNIADVGAGTGYF